jgi:hypothetical protein
VPQPARPSAMNQRKLHSRRARGSTATPFPRQWGILGGGDRLPTITERLRENHRPVVRPKPVPEKLQKRWLVARGR